LPAPESVGRFETDPGRQLQVDWCVFRRGKHPLSAFVPTLGFSRHTYVEFVTTEQFAQLKQCHISAFEYFGGVPLEILYDNMKTVVLERNTFGAGQHRFHPGLWDLGKHFGFTPRVCRPYRAQTNGKVERFNRYLRNSFYYPLQSSLKQADLALDVDTANAEVLNWLRDVANNRTHKTTGIVPAVRLEQERQALQSLPVFNAEKPKTMESLPVRSWPVETLKRAPAEYEQLVGVCS
jgi:transposase